MRRERHGEFEVTEKAPCDKCEFLCRHICGSINIISHRALAAEMAHWPVEELWACTCYYYYCYFFQWPDVKGGVPPGELAGISVPSCSWLDFLGSHSQYLQTPLLTQSDISLNSEWVMGSSLFKVKNNSLNISISSQYYFFYSTWLALIDIFHLPEIHFLLHLWKMRKVTYIRE